MKRLIDIFHDIKNKYSDQQELYKQKIEQMRQRRGRDAEVCHLLFNEIKILTNELDLILTRQDLSAQEIKEIKAKLKMLKRDYKQLNELTKPVWRQWTEAILFAAILALIIRNFVFGLYHVPSGSAEPNLLVGDRIWGNKLAYLTQEVNRGDLVIFDNPEFNFDSKSNINYWWQKYVGIAIPLLGLGNGPDNWVKRVIGVPGDVIEGRIEDGKTVIYRNGQRLDEPYVNRYPLIRLRKFVGFFDSKFFGPFTVPSFLRGSYKESLYTYDQSMSGDSQPYYKFTQNQVIKSLATGDPYIIPPFTPDKGGNDVFGPLTIPAGKYWVMGDSRNNSRDSRFWLFLDKSLIHGRASFIIWSLDSEESIWFIDLIKHPINFWVKNLRWNRFFKGLGIFNGK